MKLEVTEYRKRIANLEHENIGTLISIIMNDIDYDRGDRAEASRERRPKLPRTHEEVLCVAGEEAPSSSTKRSRSQR